MKTLRKIIPLMLLAASAISVSGCSMYHSKADKKENFVGFYVLETYNSKHTKTDEDTYDRKAEEGITACFTLDINGYGYYGYKSNTVEAWVKPVYSTFVKDDDDESLYKAINLTDNLKKVYAWDWKVGDLYEPTMGFNNFERVIEDRPWPFKDKKETVQTLSYTIPWHTYTIYNPDKEQVYQDVIYKKVSSSTDYKQINKLLGTNFVPNKPMEMGGTNGYYVYSYGLKEGQSSFVPPYEYAIIDTESYSNGKMKMYYSETSNPGKKITEVPVTITTPGSAYKVNVFGKDYYGSINNSYDYKCVTFLNTDSSQYTDQDPYASESFSPYYSEAATIDDVINSVRQIVTKDVVIEGMGGTDEQASNPAELKAELLNIKSYSGNYYDSLKDKEEDPEPDPEKYNSLAITVDGWLKDSEGNTIMDRKLVVTQNHLGAYYQIDGYSIDNKGTKTDLNAVIGFSKYGMYFLANHYNVTSTESSESDEVVKILCDELNANRGKFYKVAVEKEVPSYEQIMMSGDEDAAYEALGYQATKSVAEGLYNNFVDTLNGNNNALNYLISLLDYFDDEEQVEQYDGEYIAHTSSYNIRVNLRDTAKPSFYIEEKEGREVENITLEHINNTKVEIVKEGVGDFGDLLAKRVADYYRQQYEEHKNEQGMGA